MKDTTRYFLGLGILFAVARASGAEQAKIDQAYFEAEIFKGQKLVSRPHAVVTVGADGKISFSDENGEGPRLGLEYKVSQSSASGLTATVTASVDSKEVAAGTLHFAKDRGTSATLQGGTYSWHVTVNYVTKDLVNRRRGRKW